MLSSLGRFLLLVPMLLLASPLPAREPPPADAKQPAIFARDNLVAWCIVPFDSKKRTPEERAEMLKKLGFQKYAYDWRTEHLPTFEREIAALQKNGIELTAVWFPATLNADAKLLLESLKKHRIKTQLWVTMNGGGIETTPEERAKRIAAHVLAIRPIAEEADKIGCRLGLYNHGGWFGEPENLIAIIEQSKLKNVGIVYNLHHGHDHLDRFPKLLETMKPHLYAINLNGMIAKGDQTGQKIIPLGAGADDLSLLKAIQKSGYRGLVGILGHTQDDAEQRLGDNLAGLDWLLPQLDGKPAGQPVQYRTYKAPPPKQSYDSKIVSDLLASAVADGDARRGAQVYASPKFACSSCHKIGTQGGIVGPELTAIGICIKPEEIVESVLWPAKAIREGYAAISIQTADGKTVQGYPVRENAQELTLRDPASGTESKIPKGTIEVRKEVGTLMPNGIAEAMTAAEKRDLIRFLLELGKKGGMTGEAMLAHANNHTVEMFPIQREPLRPEIWPNFSHPVNRNRMYDFYAQEAIHFSAKNPRPAMVPGFPGIDGGKMGHWGNQTETTWADDRWNDSDLGSLQCGVFRSGDVTVPRGICVRFGDKLEMAACFNPETLSYEALWQGGFVKFSAVRHGFMDGLKPVGKLLPRPAGKQPDKPFEYRGLYRSGSRVVFAYRIDGIDYLDSPTVANGQFVRQVAPAKEHPLKDVLKGGQAQWPNAIETKGTLGAGSPYAIDTIAPPFNNPWKSLFFFGDHDFMPDGSAMICTMEGDVWHVTGLDDKLDHVRWRRYATGLHQALGLVVADGLVYVLGRDQITRLHDLNGDGEADYYERFSASYFTSTAGHDFICGLQRDSAGRFYTVSGKQGLLQISADGKECQALATGFRNPDGLGIRPDGTLTIPCSEGDWTPCSMVCEFNPNQSLAPKKVGNNQPPHFGYGGPKNGKAPDLPMLDIPRGIDNSSGGQVYVDSDRWGPLKGQMVHFSYGTGTHHLLLRDEVSGQPQGALVPLDGDFRAGVHRGRFNPKDGQLYASGMGGWGTYTPDDGCFQRVRYTGQPVQLPRSFQAKENGLLISFTEKIDPKVAGDKANFFLQAWNYRYSAGYGSQEFSPSHYGTIAHDTIEIKAVHLLPDGRSIFVEAPDLQPVNQLHLRYRVDGQPARDIFATVHDLGPAFADFPGYKFAKKTIGAHPILTDLSVAAKTVPNPFKKSIPGARLLTIEAGKNLSFVQRTLKAKPGEAIKLTFANPDVVPHNWVLVKPGSKERVGDLANKLIADPDAVGRHYIPQSDDVLFHTDIVQANESFSIFFQAPKAKGRYPYICTFPGHWMVMNGELVVE